MEPKKHKCLLIASGTRPSRANPCLLCSMGPCLFGKNAPPSGGRPPKRGPKGPPVTRKVFPFTKESQNYVMDSTAVPITQTHYYRSYYLPDSPWVFWYEEGVSGRYHTSDMLTEINRLPSSMGTQCVHERVFVPAADVVLHTNDQAYWIATNDALTEQSSQQRFCYLDVATSLCATLSPSNRHYEDLLPTSLEKEIRAAEAYAFNAMRPSFKTGFSMLNFLLEFDDLTTIVPSTLKSLRRLIDTVPANLLGRGSRVKGSHLRRLPDLTKSSLNEVCNVLAEAKLITDFAIKPLIGDIKKVCTIMTRFKSNLDRFREGARSLEQRRHFRSFIEATTEYKESRTAEVSAGHKHGLYRYRCTPSMLSQHNGTPTDHVAYNATMVYTYACKTLADMDPYVAALYQVLGLKPDASILWNATPFSFVLDWFVDIQGFLGKYASVDLISSEVTIHSWLSSIRARPQWTCVPVDVTWDDPLKTGFYSLPTVTLQGQSYNRLIRNPDPDELASLNRETPDGLTLNRGLLSAALVKKLVFH